MSVLDAYRDGLALAIARNTKKPRKRVEFNLKDRLVEQAKRFGARLWCNNVGTHELARGGYMQSGLCPGSSDLIGYTVKIITPEMVGQKIAVFTAVEVKKAGRDTTEKHRRERQERFIASVAFDGGIAQIVRSVQELEIVLKR